MVQDNFLGNYTTCVAARSTNRGILAGSQDGGIATGTLAFALEEGIIDGAIVSIMDPSEPFKPLPYVATSPEELYLARGTKYSLSPNLSLIKEATRSYGLDRVGIVGVPCQMQGLRKGQLYPIGLRDVPDKIALAVGIFCMENFPYQSIIQLVEDHGNTKLENVVKLDIGKGKFWIYTERGAVVQLPLKITHKYEQPGCHVCLDYVANLADISTGSVGTPDGWSTVFVRSKKGNDVWARALAAGAFETKPIEEVKPGLELVMKLATEKITKNRKSIEERASFGVGKGLRNPYI